MQTEIRNWNAYGNKHKTLFENIKDYFNNFQSPTIYFKNRLSNKDLPKFNLSDKLVIEDTVEKSSLPNKIFLDRINSILSDSNPNSVNEPSLEKEFEYKKQEISKPTVKEIEVIVEKEIVKYVPKVIRKEFHVPWFPKIGIKRNMWVVPIPKLKWRLPLLKKLGWATMVIIFPMLLIASAYIIYTVKDMYDNGFVNNLQKYKIDNMINEAVNPIKHQQQLDEEILRDLNLHKQNIVIYQRKTLYRKSPASVMNKKYNKENKPE